jgi:hypothetical protein
MLIDKETLLSDEQAVTATAFSSNSYDTGDVTGGRNLGRTTPGLRAVFTVDETATAAGAATVTFEIGEADDAAGTGFRALASSSATALADMASGAKPFDVPIPDTGKRFLMGRYTVATGPLTAGKFSLALVNGSDHRRAYPSGHNASQF